MKLTRNLSTSDLDIIKNDINLDLDIETKVNETKRIRIKELVSFLKTLYGGKCSLRTITRAIYRVRDKKKILIVTKKDNFEQLGIENKDGRARYAIIPHLKNKHGLLDVAFKLLNSKNDADITLALLEIEDTRDITFSLDRLNILTKKISFTNEEKDYQIIRIIKDQIFYRKSIPDAQTLEILRKATVHYRTIKNPNYNNIRPYLIELLGILQDYSFIEELKYDMFSEKTFEAASGNVYSFYSVMDVIDKYQAELFTIQRDLMRKGLEKNTKYIQYVRNQIKVYLRQREQKGNLH